jgi:hypothetical protein
MIGFCDDDRKPVLRLEVLLPDEEVSDVLGHEVVHPALHQGSVHLLVIDDLPERKNARQFKIVHKVSPFYLNF